MGGGYGKGEPMLGTKELLKDLSVKGSALFLGGIVGRCGSGGAGLDRSG